MVAAFPFVDNSVRHKYMSTRVYGLVAAKRAKGLEVGYQVLLDTAGGVRDHRRSMKCLVSTLGSTIATFPPTPEHAHLHFLVLLVLRNLIRRHNDVRIHASRVGFHEACTVQLRVTAELTTRHDFITDTLRILRMPLLLGDLYSGEDRLNFELAATVSRRSFLGLQSPQIPVLPSKSTPFESSDGTKSPVTYVALPVNASYITLGNWKSRLQLAYTLLQDGTSRLYLAEAAKILRGILTLQPHGCDIASLYANLGSIHLAQHELPDAIACYSQTLNRTPDAWKAHFNMGLALLRYGRLLEGKAHLQQCLAYNPSYDVAQRALEEVDTQWMSAAHDAMEKQKASQAFANQLSGVLAVVKHQTTYSHADSGTFVAVEHAAAAFAVDMSRQCAVPVTTPLSRGWHGVVAALLHRLYVFASLKHLHMTEVFAEYSVTATESVVTMDGLDAIVVLVTGKAMTRIERQHIQSLFPSGEILCPILLPNPETIHTIETMANVGPWFHGLYGHTLHPPQCRHLGLWEWLEMPLFTWIKSINHGRCQVAKYSKILVDMGLYTVIHLAQAQPTLRPQDFKALELSERGTLIFELFGLRSSVERAAGSIVQGAGRTAFARAKLRQLRELRHCALEDRDAAMVPRSRLQEELARTDMARTMCAVWDLVLTRTMQEVLQAPPPIETFVCIPIRTELRQRANVAAAVIQQTVRILL
ncbi:hypothetical protein H257_08196 [Aphanomyces astaci]|uniref:Uncharacterized protein n=2 Tax=Aphanomyces astaci TaxID=112090 RepID=W4GE52_APHAT|nr:hypothetical protein H257_08196 [Aphanomyces astaci]ETV77967.1 hypothetical protein H257_08196 [Aphanomyces astaci]|eukprot:XP_009832306.1 hypothetical protein H257_08196 [Aphanomyces astaci]